MTQNDQKWLKIITKTSNIVKDGQKWATVGFRFETLGDSPNFVSVYSISFFIQPCDAIDLFDSVYCSFTDI